MVVVSGEREEADEDGLETAEVVVVSLLLLLSVVVVDDGEDGEVREVFCFIMAVHAADEVQDRHLGFCQFSRMSLISESICARKGKEERESHGLPSFPNTTPLGRACFEFAAFSSFPAESDDKPVDCALGFFWTSEKNLSMIRPRS